MSYYAGFNVIADIYNGLPFKFYNYYGFIVSLFKQAITLVSNVDV